LIEFYRRREGKGERGVPFIVFLEWNEWAKVSVGLAALGFGGRWLPQSHLAGVVLLGIFRSSLQNGR